MTSALKAVRATRETSSCWSQTTIFGLLLSMALETRAAASEALRANRINAPRTSSPASDAAECAGIRLRA